jgi:hypothetical protein
MWHHPIGGELTGYNTYSLCVQGQPDECRRVMATVTKAFIPNVNIVKPFHNNYHLWWQIQ